MDQKKLRADQVPKFTMLREAEPRSGFLEPEDFPRLRRELPEFLRSIATLSPGYPLRSAATSAANSAASSAAPKT